MQAAAKISRNLIRLPFFVERDSFADIIDDDLARIAAGHMPFKFFADSRSDGAVHVLVQERQ